MFLLLRSKRAALLYDGENTEDKPVSQKGRESECGVDVSSRISLVSSGGGFLRLLVVLLPFRKS